MLDELDRDFEAETGFGTGLRRHLRGQHEEPEPEAPAVVPEPEPEQPDPRELELEAARDLENAVDDRDDARDARDSATGRDTDA